MEAMLHMASLEHSLWCSCYMHPLLSLLPCQGRACPSSHHLYPTSPPPVTCPPSRPVQTHMFVHSEGISSCFCSPIVPFPVPLPPFCHPHPNPGLDGGKPPSTLPHLAPATHKMHPDQHPARFLWSALVNKRHLKHLTHLPQQCSCGNIVRMCPHGVW